MNEQVYLQLKTILKNYHFDETANFYHLYKYARLQGFKHFYFREFVYFAKQLGVCSKMQRSGDTVQRVLVYNAKNDKYLSRVFPKLDICATCNGSGYVEITL